MTAAPKKAAGSKAPAKEPVTKSAPELELSAVKTLVKMGKAKGNLTDEEIQGALSDIDLSEDQFENVYAFFVKSGIEIADEHIPEDLEDVPADEDADPHAALREGRRHRRDHGGRSLVVDAAGEHGVQLAGAGTAAHDDPLSPTANGDYNFVAANNGFNGRNHPYPNHHSGHTPAHSHVYPGHALCHHHLPRRRS